MANLLPRATSGDPVVQNARAAVLPVGSYEQHGPFLPLATDAIVASVVADAVATEYGLLLLPPLTIGCSHEHAQWRGTVSVRASTLYAVVNDVIDSLYASGVEKLLIVNGHGGNYVLSNVVQEASVRGPHVALFPTSGDWQAARDAACLQERDGWADMHGGELETSLLLHATPDLVRPGFEEADSTIDARPNHLLSRGLGEYTKSGVIGRSSQGTADKGAAILGALVKTAGDHLRAIEVIEGPR
jgi:creatinine amidohydrolase